MRPVFPRWRCASPAFAPACSAPISCRRAKATSRSANPATVARTSTVTRMTAFAPASDIDSDRSEFDRSESAVRSYCREMNAVFARAVNAQVWDENGNAYIDFLSACGSLNYGHNPPALKLRLLNYLAGDGVLNALDLHTVAKRDFLRAMREQILAPRGLDYRLQFPGPTGTNAVEAALKLARKVTGRRTVAAFTNAFHGMTLGALAVTGRSRQR